MSDHPQLPDGTHIHTSPLVQAGEDEKQSLLLSTRSGNQYHLAENEMFLAMLGENCMGHTLKMVGVFMRNRQ